MHAVLCISYQRTFAFLLAIYCTNKQENRSFEDQFKLLINLKEKVEIQKKLLCTWLQCGITGGSLVYDIVTKYTESLVCHSCVVTIYALLMNDEE